MHSAQETRDTTSPSRKSIPVRPPYYRARYYDPQSGRFLNEDPSGFGAGTNFYVYTWNNPVNYLDPFGRNALRDFLCKYLKLPKVPLYPPFESPATTKEAVDNVKTWDPILNGQNLFQLERNTGPWNYKDQGEGGQYDAAGNFNFGYACAEMGFSEYTCLSSGSAYHKLFGTGHGSGIPFVLPPFGNTPDKYNQINDGYNYN